MRKEGVFVSNCGGDIAMTGSDTFKTLKTLKKLKIIIE